MLIDTHCHIHDPEFYADTAQRQAVYRRAIAAGVTHMMVIGTSQADSARAVRFAAEHDGVLAAVGVHPHEAAEGWQQIADLTGQAAAIGEIGLDYFYDNAPRRQQAAALEAQLDLAIRHNLPVSFHVRDERAGSGAVWADFWAIYDNTVGVRGVLHSFTDTIATLEQGLGRGLAIGVNGISTFTRDPAQVAMFDAIPLASMVLETDAPFLTPSPRRGTINEPANLGLVARHHADRRGLPLDELAALTSANAKRLFAFGPNLAP